MQEFEPINQEIQQWGQRTLTAMKQAGKSMGILHRSNSTSSGDSLSGITVKNKKSQGDLISRISFQFKRTLVYTYYGAGNGRGGQKGSSWYNAKGERKRTNPKSLDKAGTAGREAKPLFDVINDQSLSELANIVTAKTGDVIVSNIFGKQKIGK